MSLAKEIISSDEISLISEAQLASFTTPSKSPKRYGKKISKPSVYFLINISLYIILLCSRGEKKCLHLQLQLQGSEQEWLCCFGLSGSGAK